MSLNNLTKIVQRPAKRVGRGLASGKGKTAGRGTKGQKSRSGYNIPRRFQGGQTAMIQRLPKVRGFISRFAKPIVITLAKIELKFNDGEEVNFKTLIEKGLIKKNDKSIKIIGAKAFTKKLKFSDVVLSRTLAAEYKKIAVEAEVVKAEKSEKTEKPAKVVKEKAPVKKTTPKIAK